jgi:parvulin-like peptidyl-prolyl isomerase
VRDAIGASLPTAGPQARVLRLVTSTRDEALVARLQLVQFDYPFEEVLSQASDRPGQGQNSGDLGWVARGAEAREFDEVVFGGNTPLDEWTEPFSAGTHWEILLVQERRDSGSYDERNLTKMKERAFTEWLTEREAASDIERDLSAQERQWAIDRASKGIIETTNTPR